MSSPRSLLSRVKDNLVSTEVLRKQLGFIRQQYSEYIDSEDQPRWFQWADVQCTTPPSCPVDSGFSVLPYLTKMGMSQARLLCETIVQDLCFFQRTRSHTVWSDKTNDPIHLCCEEAKEWLSLLTKPQGTEDILTSVERRIVFYESLQNDSIFPPPEPNVPDFCHMLKTKLIPSLKELKAQFQLCSLGQRCSSSFDQLALEIKCVLKHTAELLLFIFNDIPTLPNDLDVMHGLVHIEKTPALSPLLTTISGRLLSHLTTTPTFMCLFSHVPTPDPWRADYKNPYLAQNGKLTLPAIVHPAKLPHDPPFENIVEMLTSKIGGIKEQFHKCEGAMERFVRIHGILYILSWFSLWIQGAKLLAAQTGEMLTVGCVRDSLRMGIMSIMQSIRDLKICILTIHKHAASLANFMQTKKSRLAKDPWLDRYTSARRGYIMKDLVVSNIDHSWKSCKLLMDELGSIEPTEFSNRVRLVSDSFVPKTIMLLQSLEGLFDEIPDEEFEEAEGPSTPVSMQGDQFDDSMWETGTGVSTVKKSTGKKYGDDEEDVERGSDCGSVARSVAASVTPSMAILMKSALGSPKASLVMCPSVAPGAPRPLTFQSALDDLDAKEAHSEDDEEPDQPATKYVEVFENQKNKWSGWTGKSIPGVHPWSSEEVRVPLTKDDPPPSGFRWRHGSDWALVRDEYTDEEGWRYAAAFGDKRWTPMKLDDSVVRRRRWKREIESFV